MRAFILAKIGLLPFVLFWAMARSDPERAIYAALALAILLNLWRWRRGGFKQVEIAALVLFAILAGALLAAPAFIATRAVPLSFFAVAATAFISLARNRPWTADYSAAAHPGQEHNPIFIGVNKALSALWMAIFFALGVLAWLHVSHWVMAALTLSGAFLSIFGPNWLVRAVLKRKLAAQRDFDWPTPDFHQAHGGEELDVVVIGAGIGGLAAGALLAAKGLKVKLFEQHVLPGGFCHSWLRKAQDEGAPRLFRFDAGPHDFSGAWPGGTLDRLLRRLGCADKVEWLRLDYRFIRSNGEVFDPPRDWREHAEALARRHPADEDGIVKTFEIMKALFDAMSASGDGFAGPLATVEAMLQFAKTHPLYVAWAERPFIELVTHNVADEAARAALLSMVGYISGDAAAPSCAEMAPIFGYYFKGGFYPKGGSSQFAEALAQALIDHGGAIATKTPVRKILVENGRAIGLLLENGETVRARAIVANSDPRKTFLEMVGAEHLPPDFRERIAAARPDVSGFAVHLGVKGEWEGRPLTFVRGDLNMLIARPGLIDPSDAPQGYSAVDILTLMPHDKAKDWFPEAGGSDWRDWRRSEDYRRRKEALAADLIAEAEKALPGLRERIVLRCEASPVTYARYSLSSSGAIYGIAPGGRMRGSKSPIPGLFVAGAINLGPGVEAAALSGVWAAEAVAPDRLYPARLAPGVAERGAPATVA